MSGRPAARALTAALAKTQPKEHFEQVTVIRWIDLHAKAIPELSLRFAVPNGAKRSVWEATQAKSEGMQAGVPDLWLPVARGGFHGLAIEMKRKHSGEVSKAQADYIARLSGAGWSVHVCHGAGEAIAVIAGYFGVAP